MDERVKFVGGPKDGEDYPWTTSRFVIVPDATEMIHYICGDGESGTLFGQHTYEMKCYAKFDASGYQREYKLEYAGYAPPVLRPGMRPIVFP